LSRASKRFLFCKAILRPNKFKPYKFYEKKKEERRKKKEERRKKKEERRKKKEERRKKKEIFW
jgi:hypothetical protein